MSSFVSAPKALLLLSACAASACVAPASAADLPSRYAPRPDTYYTPAPIFSWTGFYAGVNAQFGFGSFSQGGSVLFGSPVGGLGGATVGYNFQSGQLLIGVEADAAFGSISGSGDFGVGTSSSGTINGVGTLRARVGYIFNNQTLFYVTGGYAGTELNGKVTDVVGSPNFVLNEGHYLSGYAVGAGVEYAITTRWSVKGEYVFDGFGSQTYFGGTRDGLTSGANLSTIRVGVNYHFF